MFGYRVKDVKVFIFNIVAVDLRILLSSFFSQQLKMLYMAAKNALYRNEIKTTITLLSEKFIRMNFYSSLRKSIVLFYIKNCLIFNGGNKSL